jgi:hypothetical protein
MANADKKDRVLTLQPIDYWRMLDDFASWIHQNLIAGEAKELVDKFLADITRPGFDPSHERALVESMQAVAEVFVPLPSKAGRNIVAKMCADESTNVVPFERQ